MQQAISPVALSDLVTTCACTVPAELNSCRLEYVIALYGMVCLNIFMFVCKATPGFGRVSRYCCSSNGPFSLLPVRQHSP